MSGGKEGSRLESTAVSPSGTVEGRTRGYVGHLQTLRNATSLSKRWEGTIAALKYYTFVASPDSHLGTLLDFESDALVEEAAEVAFGMENQNI